MAIINCSECGKDISDKASFCVGCGMPLTNKPFLSQSNFDNPSYDRIKSVLWSLKEKITETAEVAATQGRDFIKSKQEKDAEAIDKLSEGFGEKTSSSDNDKDRARFKAALESTIDAKFAEVMIGKTDAERFLTFIDGQILTSSVRNVFRSALGTVPSQIEAACNLSEAILAPSSEERERLIKTAVGVGGGSVGIAMIITGVGGALGWGVGVIASVSAFFVGTSMTGPIGWAVAGITIAGIAAYFATTSNKHTDTERFLTVLKASTGRGVDALWPEHEVALNKVMASESAT